MTFSRIVLLTSLFGLLTALVVSGTAAQQSGAQGLIDAQVARTGVAWSEKPWTLPIWIAQERTRKV